MPTVVDVAALRAVAYCPLLHAVVLTLEEAEKEVVESVAQVTPSLPVVWDRVRPETLLPVVQLLVVSRVGNVSVNLLVDVL